MNIVKSLELRSRLDDTNGYLVPETYDHILENIPNPMILQNGQGMIIYENKRSIEQVGCSLLGKKITDLVHPDYHQIIFNRIQRVLRNGKVSFLKIKLMDYQGNAFDAEVSCSRIRVKDQFVIMSVYLYISEEEAIKEKLIETEAKYRTLVEEALIGVFLYQDDHFVYINPYFQMRLGYTLEELNRKGLLSVIHPKDRDLIRVNLFKVYHGETNVISKVAIMTKDCKVIDVEAKASKIIYKGSLAFIGTVADITEKNATQAQIDYLYNYDTLTGLPNRNLLNELLFTVNKQDGETETIMSLILLDIDRFKLINDTYGHGFGDSLLQEISKRLKTCIRKQDVIVRYSGDEFVILLQRIKHKQTERMAVKIMSDFSHPFMIGLEEIFVSASMGIVHYPQHGHDLETLLKNADSALHFVKQNGRNGFKVYSPLMSQGLPRIVQLERDMRKAINRNELVLNYQPLVNLSSGNIIGNEALIRWKHPQLGLVSPAEFIPLAEENGMILSIGEWVLETACRQNKKFQQDGLSHLIMAVNISPRQFKERDFTNKVKRVLKETKLDAKYLELEITESLTLDIEQTRSVIKELKEIGVRIAIDDFGTGYSSLSVLKHCPIDTLKIDKSFVQDIASNAKLVAAMIEMAHTLNFKVIAEGIEQEYQHQFLKEHKCDMGQGYLFGRPQSPI